ncbi:unnamed protein product [Caenorhabditis auriculariae]|uniref:Dystroglycan-type cadherin-like domain-containing protein n=1 Tax=Caenorhabditis auriculariae TaxID=2777116 RepID=A0A8S1GZ10_9PELO|nr:unnamed protein product [Caenorhabditis auriculariae]
MPEFGQQISWITLRRRVVAAAPIKGLRTAGHRVSCEPQHVVTDWRPRGHRTPRLSGSDPAFQAAMLLFALLFIELPILLIAFKTQHLTTPKGKFFVHTLHSAHFFPNTVKVKWEATLRNKPALPNWLRVMPSRHPELAYLIGTPVTDLTQVTVHVIAKRLENFEIQQQHLVLTLVEDLRYTESTKQVIDIHLRNLGAEELINNRDRKIEQLENAAKSTFRGKGVNPYIVNIRPAFTVPLEKEHLFRNRIGSIVTIGTQKKFFPTTFTMVHNLRTNPSFCRRNNEIAMNKFFAPTFEIDWCKTDLRNVSLTEDTDVEKTAARYTEPPLLTLGPLLRNGTPEPPPQEMYGYSGYNFWNSVVLFPLIGIICVILILILSVIFFGCREGQKWRDYKTSREKLEEYMSVRESQKHLRELSVQRQLLSMAQDSRSTAPSGIHSFLQPRSRATSSSTARFSKSASRLNDREDTIELLPATEMLPVGKQTVAEAAKQCGSSLHLYRNPLDSESEDNDSDSLEDKHST